MSEKAGIVAFQSSKNCFINIPKNWTLKRQNSKVPVFEVVGPGGRLVTTWAGGVTLPSSDGSDVVELNGLFAAKQNIQHGDEVVISQLCDVPTCSQVFVEPLSITDWEILEQHAAFIENSLLHQVRAVWSGQVIPIWVQRGICVFIKIGQIDPAAKCCLLEQHTEVMVAPKMRGAIQPQPTNSTNNKRPNQLTSKPNGNKPITSSTRRRNLSGNFAQDLKQAAETYTAHRRASSAASLAGTKMGDGIGVKSASTIDDTADKVSEPSKVQQVLNYWQSWWHKEQPQGEPEVESLPVYESEVLGADFQGLLRVQGCSEAVQNGLLYGKQATSVYITLETYQGLFRSGDISSQATMPKTFLAVIQKVLSPTERDKLQDKKSRQDQVATIGKSTNQVAETPSDSLLSKYVNKSSPRSHAVRVVIISNNKASKQISLCHIAIPDLLRLQLGLEGTAKVKLLTIASEPVEVRKIVLHPLRDPPNGFTKDMLLTAAATWCENVSTVQCPLVICQGTIVQIPLTPDVNCDFLVTTTSFDKSSSDSSDYHLLSPEVVPKMSIGEKLPSATTLLTGHVEDLDHPVPRRDLSQLGGVRALCRRGLRHLDLHLHQRPLSREFCPGVCGCSGLLLCGAKGTGKSAIGQTLCKHVSLWPNRAYTTVLDCRKLRGKRIESLRRTLEQLFDEAAWRQPSVLLLDDLDRLTAAPAGPEQEMSGEAVYYGRVAEVLKDIMDKHLASGANLVVIATSISRASLHPSLVSSRGKTYFTEVIEIPPPSESERTDILHSLLSHKPGVSPACIDDLDLATIGSRTEGYVARDLEMIVTRALHAHRMVLPHSSEEEVTLRQADLEAGMEGFTPAALRNVSLHQGDQLGWGDVGGLHQVRETVIQTLQWPAQYPKLFASCPLRLRSGLLLYGAPGTGKTLLAGVLAKECALNFISIKGPELLSKYIGASEQSVRDTFLRAQSAKPCILFFDEFDSLAPRRGHDSTGVTDRVVNQLLTQLDGVEALQGVYVLAATSRPDLIDPALLRPGRLDKAIHCPLPDKTEREEILNALTRHMTLAADVDLPYLADVCEYFTGADLKALLYNAQLEAIHESVGSSKGGEGDTTVDGERDEVESEGVDGGDEDTRSDVGTKACVIEKTRPDIQPDVVYIPNLEEGVVSLTAEQQAIHLQQYQNSMLPPGAKSTKRGVAVIQQRHLVTAARDMGPSVSAAERNKYNKIYETFVASRGGNFAEPVPPSEKKATLA